MAAHKTENYQHKQYCLMPNRYPLYSMAQCRRTHTHNTCRTSTFPTRFTRSKSFLFACRTIPCRSHTHTLYCCSAATDCRLSATARDHSQLALFVLLVEFSQYYFVLPDCVVSCRSRNFYLCQLKLDMITALAERAECWAGGAGWVMRQFSGLLCVCVQGEHGQK